MSDPTDAATPHAAETGESVRAPYRVLARKYRPTNFADLIGQDALVRTLSNAIDSGRMAQAFVLTGVRGVGKTTTARIIARALNCIGPDGQGGPTTQPCGVCEHCTAIAEDRHVDVIEMDAASRTGVDDIRDLIDGVRYRPVSARRKVYIVDEVHMLSKQAFNALLKTLEEPPEHVVFVFATTEIRKVPITVLSRCMRFDLRRVEQETLAAHFRGILEKEGLSAEDAALEMVARAADGSVRDGLSLLDQAIALSGDTIAEAQVKQMLGLADRGRIYDLYDAVLGGRAAEALEVLADLYNAGADPAVVLQDMLEVTHTLTRLQVVGEAQAVAGLPEVERTRGAEMARTLRPAHLARNWQMLLKGLQETQNAPQPRQAAEMVLLRLIYAAELPSPGDLVRQLREGGGETKARPDGGAGAPAQRTPQPSGGANGGGAQAVAGGGGPAPEPGPQADEAPPPPDDAPKAESAIAMPQSLRDVVALCQERRETRLAAELKRSVRLVRFEEGMIELSPTEYAPRDLAGRLGHCLTEWTGRRWVVSLSSQAGEETLAAQDEAAEAAERQRLMAHPDVQRVLDAFPGAKLIAHRGGAEAPGGSEDHDGAAENGVPIDPDDVPGDEEP
ncbi:DNA polymerase III subunit gamma/tau [Ferruginivarius sediminum]|uniref:DNA polymerase III subunit gamma/tau n=1 Tax=Ferruginivarius sediminum TaxID=2661937 RepID=A0A369T5X0_9PROT|nr:DNA polymerase III subunit gamma/tau [Ferruginivarius sediminum]RDD60719.1 DNA polymerase III subunit gamma/tau [Ferruginivarius sediminum]